MHETRCRRLVLPEKPLFWRDRHYRKFLRRAQEASHIDCSANTRHGGALARWRVYDQVLFLPPSIPYSSYILSSLLALTRCYSLSDEGRRGLFSTRLALSIAHDLPSWATLSLTPSLNLRQ